MKELKVLESKVKKVMEEHPEVKEIMSTLFDGQLTPEITYKCGDRFLIDNDFDKYILAEISFKGFGSLQRALLTFISLYNGTKWGPTVGVINPHKVTKEEITKMANSTNWKKIKY
jgi:hypothetical protein